MAKLEVEIGAKTQKLEKGLKDAQKALEKFQNKSKQIESQLQKNQMVMLKVDSALEKLNKDYKEGAIDVTKYSNGVKILEGRQNALAQNANKLSTDLSRTNKSIRSLANNSMPQLGKSTANAVPAVTELSRVIQDAPFGIQGVGNNIQQLTAVFGNLSRQTGGSSAALKEMLKALTGPAGVLFAVSVITSALTVFGDKLFSSTKKTNAFLKALKEVGSQSIVEFKALTDVILDTNASQREQIRAINILKEKYKDFDTSLITNAKNYKSAKKAIDDYVNSLVVQARAQAALQLIQEKQSRILELEEKRLLKIRNEYGSATLDQFEQRRKRFLAAIDRQLGDLSGLSDKERKIREGQIQKLKDNLNNRYDAVKNLGQKEIDELEMQIQRLAKLGNIRAKILAQQPGGGFNIPRAEAQTLDTNLQATGLQNIDLSIPEAVLQRPITQISKLQLTMEEALTAFNTQMDNIIRNNIANTFMGIGEAIGNALSGAANLGDSLAKVLLSAIGNVLTQLGQLAITIGVTLLKIQVSLSKLKGGIAIAAGVAAIALGSVFKSGAAKIGGNFSGGVGGGGSTGGRSFGGGGGFGGAQPFSGNLTFTIRGNDLVAVVNNAIDQTSIFGGNVTISN